MFSGLVTALRTLTLLPVPGKEAERFSDSLHWFTFVGCFVGLFQAGLAWSGLAAGWPELAALLALAGGIVFTRGLHADGLADLADGFFGGRDREAILRIMKDPAVGSFGAVALVLVLLAKWVALLRLASHGGLAQIATGAMLARMSQVLLAVRLPYARQGSGTAKAFVEGAGTTHLVSALLSGAVATMLLCGPDPIAALVPFAAALVAAVAVGLLSLRRIGGVTGDVLGAVSETTELFVWFACVLSLPS